MRAGTFFALSVAVVLGLGSAAAAKYLGFFDKKAEPPPPVAEKTPEKAAPPMVLVAAGNLFKGMTITQQQVRVRPLRKEEETDYAANRKDYLPATVTAAAWRIPMQNIAADTPLTIKHFGGEFEKQEFGSLGMRIDPYMRAVNIEVEKNRCAGGLIQAGERVDVFLTSKITDGSGTAPFIRTAMIAKDVKIIAKRDMLATILGSNPEGKPLHFTLQANPYRAALIEFAVTSGTLSLVPRPQPRSMGMMMGDKNEKKDEKKDEAPKEGMPNFADPDSKEYRDENERVAQIERGELSIGTVDLARVFNLPDLPLPPKRIETPPPPLKVETPKPAPVVVVNIKGVEKEGETVFGDQPKPEKPKPEPKPEVKKPEREFKQRVYRFYDLQAKVVIEKDGDSSDSADCPTCGKKDK